MKYKLIVIIIIAFSSFFFIQINGNASQPWQSFGQAIDIQISDEFEPIYMKDNTFQTYEKDYYIKDRLQYYTRVDEILLRSKVDSSIYLFAYRVVTSPQDGRNWGVAGIGSYGRQWVNNKIITSIQLRSGYKLLNYAPKNNPSKTTGSIGLGLDSTGLSVSASVDYNHSELEIISNSNIANNYYETYYKINISLAYPVVSNYVKRDIFSFGMLMFQYSGTVFLDVKHEITYYDDTYLMGGDTDIVVFSMTY